MLWQDSSNKTWLICINMSYPLDKSMKRRTLSKCVFKNWTRYELHIVSKLLLTTNVLIREESKGIKQRQESGNLAKKAMISLDANKQ